MENVSQRICTDLRRYNKEKGWPLAHEAADRIEELETQLANQKANMVKLGQIVKMNTPG